MLLSGLIGPLLQPISPVLSVVVVTALIVVCMTWAAMPVLTRILAWWLYPKAVQKSPDKRTPRQ
jgi:antibiotic biosynthesis monooxygenase (ABM) superfamily enzyme